MSILARRESGGLFFGGVAAGPSIPRGAPSGLDFLRVLFRDMLAVEYGPAAPALPCS